MADYPQQPASVPVSVLDLAPVMGGSTAARALNNTVDLARRTEALGYRRYWVAEHHNTPNVASCAPAVLVGCIAAATSSLRVGSGGVMLPNHPPLAVAEQFGTLEALHPGRIDLGLGRAPGTDPVTALALNRSAEPLSGTEFPEQVDELLDYFGRRDDDGGTRPSTADIAAVPAAEHAVPVWMLGTSPSSAGLAGTMGLPLAVAHHLRTENTVPAFDAYRRSFRPRHEGARPYAILSVMVIAADTDDEAHRLAGPVALSMLQSRVTPKLSTYPSQEDADAHVFTSEEREFVGSYLVQQIIGGPETVARKVSDLLARTGADELMALTLVHDHAARVKSYEVLAEAMAGVRPGAAVAHAD